MKLPKDIENKVRIANEVQRKHIEDRVMFPSPGRLRTPNQPAKTPTIVTGDSSAELDAQLDTLGSTLGPRTPGNKRWGRTPLYADLVENFRKLRSLGIALPKGKSLSKKALRMGLGDILRKHGCTELTERTLEKNTKKRNDLANKMSRVFGRVSEAIEKNPAKIGKL